MFSGIWKKKYVINDNKSALKSGVNEMFNFNLIGKPENWGKCFQICQTKSVSFGVKYLIILLDNLSKQCP